MSLTSAGSYPKKLNTDQSQVSNGIVNMVWGPEWGTLVTWLRITTITTTATTTRWVENKSSPSILTDFTLCFQYYYSYYSYYTYGMDWQSIKFSWLWFIKYIHFNWSKKRSLSKPLPLDYCEYYPGQKKVNYISFWYEMNVTSWLLDTHIVSGRLYTTYSGERVLSLIARI